MKSSSGVAGDTSAVSVLSAHCRIITAMETGGLYYTRTLNTLFLLMIEILHVL